MSLSARNRSKVYHGLRAAIDDEAVNELLSHFPARDLDEPVTRDHLAAELARLEQRMTDRFATTDMAIAALEQRMTDRFAATDASTAASIAALDQRTAEGFRAVDQQLSARLEALHTQLNQEMRRWFVASTMIMAGLVTGLAAFIGT